MPRELVLGPLAKPMSEQVPELSSGDAAHIDLDLQAINRLRIRGYLSNSAAESANQKLVRNIQSAVKKPSKVPPPPARLHEVDLEAGPDDLEAFREAAMRADLLAMPNRWINEREMLAGIVAVLDRRRTSKMLAAKNNLVISNASMLATLKEELEAIDVWLSAKGLPADVRQGMEISRSKVSAAIDNANGPGPDVNTTEPAPTPAPRM